ncbi:MAG: 2-dehydro-3-deoxygalactonokinase [Polaromonas sp. 39-63-203]|jgi:2-dehydro-3-deoxygalactonokinase|uniref:2-dehydro-3-deoxygalactonokinase n=1 Tax=Polaromonas sp. TaxID=1869339 RepID=UPI000BD553ED|nr:2-dehydro-3-deoxygalactonokinase [Polaromonas sp.]OYY54110.1 MAG: 2-dehydro-3-deoxygalactonokinase [Polaromonas sp. 35-63-240]OYZ01835.1 MAG: 2-dehydro-3-deoxygalactonokinase [Polaromonas sp. 28-63-22]OYZ85240.1 MAG: 2-dehydro-3-deoxygalactonokinase [Polaromonas sp. 24-62-144]OZB01183.1 MAG: 2-dehydro-3-deoxygalactonokinase [Polaromonas sp. 39-63-203]HQS32933.1 2-dehydro-3-deoxygalactonokinase [Polaromonas sp.]
MNRLIAIDWGTSSLRGALIENGNVTEERAFARGILTVEPGGFPAVFESCFGDWMTQDALCLIAGMAGSQQGWMGAPYCPCPARFDDVAARLAWVVPGRIAIVPGLSIDTGGIPDVMRGEETQVFGALQSLNLQSARLVLPGTHSKWVTVTDSQITYFSTWMTGEFYALLRQHSILARTLPAHEPPPDPNAFGQGVKQALRGDGLLHTAFSARTLALFKRMAADALPSYLSGLVIGEELRCQALQPGDSVVIVGADALVARYEQALALLGVTCQRAASGATWIGLRTIAQSLRTS